MARAFDTCLIHQCAPTLAGLKVGNLFCLEISNHMLLCVILARWNRMLNSKGVYVRVLAERSGRCYIYVYRNSALENLGASLEMQNFLSGFGYEAFDVESLLQMFHRRLAKSSCFPHEVGVFLGYPIEDVRDFIAFGGKNYKHIGCWKVYNDVPNSMKIFEVYKKCDRVLRARFERGNTLSELTVAS